MVESPYMHDGVKMAKENPAKALELELEHQAFRKGQEAGADAMLEAIHEEIKKVENPYDITEGRLWGAFEESRDTFLKALEVSSGHTKEE